MLCFHIPEKNSESTYFWGNMPHFHIFSTKMMFLNIWSTDEHPKYQGDFSMTAFSRILAVYLLTLLIMISYPRPWLCAAEYVFECGSCSRIWVLIRGNICDNFNFCRSRLPSLIESGPTPQFFFQPCFGVNWKWHLASMHQQISLPKRLWLKNCTDQKRHHTLHHTPGCVFLTNQASLQIKFPPQIQAQKSDQSC